MNTFHCYHLVIILYALLVTMENAASNMHGLDLVINCMHSQ